MSLHEFNFEGDLEVEEWLGERILRVKAFEAERPWCKVSGCERSGWKWCLFHRDVKVKEVRIESIEEIKEFVKERTSFETR